MATNTMQMRSTDTTPVFRFRSDRFFNTNGSWFFLTREGTIEGPYLTRAEGETSLASYIEAMGGKPASDRQPASLSA